MIPGSAGIIWLLFIQFKGTNYTVQYGPFTSEHSCQEAVKTVIERSGRQIEDYYCFAS